MTSRKLLQIAGVALIALLTSLTLIFPADAQEKGALSGTLERVTNKFKTFCVITSSGPEILNFSDETQYKNTDATSVSQIQTGSALDVDYTVKDGKKIADIVSLKIAKVAPEALIKTEDVAAFVEKSPEKGKFMIIDSRPGPRYEEAHLPYAVSLPLHLWKEMKDKILPQDKETMLIFYCGGPTCSLSPKSAGLAKELGYKNVRVYQDGAPAWHKAGKTMVTNVQALKKLISATEKTPDKNPFFVLLDVRSPGETAKGSIPFATAMAADDLAKRSAEFPQYKKAQIIIYAQNQPTPDALKALKELYAMKFSNAAILWGGFDAWKKAEGKIASGKPADKIKFTRQIAADEISVAEFKSILEKKPGDKLVVDVRPPEEFNQGAIQGAKSVPLEVMQKDLSDLPKDKEIITYCNTGAICSLADKLLKKEGFKSRYLNATVTYQDGKPVISE